MGARDKVRIGLTCGDPRGIGSEVIAGALATLTEGSKTTDPGDEYVLIGPEASFSTDTENLPGVVLDITGPGSATSEAAAGEASIAAIERGIALALDGSIDGLVTGPISKSAIAAAGHPYPGHTELLCERTGAPDVTMIMGAESTPLGGPLRVALLTVHVPLREAPDLLTVDLVTRKTRIAAEALRNWWGIERPRLAFAGVNPHASEGGLFGDEEARVLSPAMRRLEQENDIEIVGLYPADSVFRRCIEGSIDLVVAPVHDVGLAVLKTLAPHDGVNITAGLPFPRTSPDHGTAFDIAGRGIADSGSMEAAIRLCLRFCRRVADWQDDR
jgi:4-hydroxythreonine-4-phosphate dehydrogenase